VFQFFKINILFLILLLFGHSELVAGSDAVDIQVANLCILNEDYLDKHTTEFEVLESELDIVDEGATPRRFFDNFAISYIEKQPYIDFLHCIFPIVPIRGATYEEAFPKQNAGYGLLYLQYLF
jgi:hypothetical protein